MRSRALLALFAAALGVLTLPAPAGAAFGLKDLDVTFTKGGPAEGTLPESQAGAHPFAFTTTLAANTVEEPLLGVDVPDGSVKDLFITQIRGLAGNPTAAPYCPNADFVAGTEAACSPGSRVGTGDITHIDPTTTQKVAVYNLAPPPGVAAKIGFRVSQVPVTIEVGVKPDPPYNLIARATNIANLVYFYDSELTIWGVPAAAAHDAERGAPPGAAEVPFLTLPRSCAGPLATRFEALSWQGETFVEEILNHDETGKASGFKECHRLGFAPSAVARPTTRHAESASGFEFEVAVADENLANPEGIADSDIKKTVVTLPKGMTINPSQAEGLAVCTEADLARERFDSAPGEGCPQASKVGSVEARSSLLEDRVFRGELFVAEPYANPFGSLLALYMVVKNRDLGVLLRFPGKVEPDPRTGQIVTTFDDLIEYPLSDVRVVLEGGGRAALVTPPSCGQHEVRAVFTPWAGGAPHEEVSAFDIEAGPGGGPCPSGPQPFGPDFSAGTLNNAAGQHSPFLMRLARRDGDQDMTRFDAVLPAGVTAKLAGVPWCPDPAIALARHKDGKDELRNPSCPHASQIGTVQGGAGVGSQLTYVPGKIYLAGPAGGAPLSVVAIVPAVAGPFDVGTIVVRQVLDLDPVTGEAKVLSAVSDRLPHILAGIPLRVRDIQVSVDRPDFTLNPTSCAELATRAGVWGGGGDAFSSADDFPVLRSARFQAAGCEGLGFKPRLGIKLKGGVRRGAHPALRAHVRPRPGDANFSRAVVTLPRSAFLDQAHITTICTRVQFAAGPGHGALCPKGALYGYARAWSPLVDGPVQGPVYLRSSDNNLPDLVAALTGPPTAQVQVELSARIDSVRGGIRSTFTGIPDLPVSRFILDMQGGKNGLIVNSRHLCFRPARNRAKASIVGQNGRASRTRPVVRAVRCAKRRRQVQRNSLRRHARVARASAVGGR